MVLRRAAVLRVPDPVDRLAKEGPGIGLWSRLIHSFELGLRRRLFFAIVSVYAVEWSPNAAKRQGQGGLKNANRIIGYKLFSPDTKVDTLCIASFKVILVQCFQMRFNSKCHPQSLSTAS
jgi:hypothetical protein